MNAAFFRWPLAAVLFFAAALTAYPQLMHLRYSGTVRYAEPGADWFKPGELVTDAGSSDRPLTPVQIDMAFNLQLVPHPESDPDDSVFFPASDPAGNAAAQTMRMQFGNVDLTVPIDRIEFDAPHGLVRFFGDSLGTDASLAQDNLPAAPAGSGLPTDFTFPDRVGFFSVTISDGASVAPGFFEADLFRVTPVPEPATYGAFAMALLGCFAVSRFRRRPPSTA